MSEKAWLIRPKPGGVIRIKEFLDEEIVAVGWPGIGDLKGIREYELKMRLKDLYPDNASALSALKMIVYRMEPGDYILAPQDKSIFFGRIVSDYFYQKEKDNSETGYPHQRKVEWYDLVLSREELPLELQKSTRVVRTAAELTKHRKVIDQLLIQYKAKVRNKDILKKDPEGVIQTSANAENLIERAKLVLEQELNHEDPYVRIRAAEVICSYLKQV